MDRKTFNSKMQTEDLLISAPYYNAINPTTVFFEQEQVLASVNSLGHIEFYDREERSLGAVDVPAAESPDLYGHSGQYGEMRCKSDGDSVCFQLPVYQWEDSYPHCDGEYDRWSRRIIGWFQVVFDCKTHQITIVD